MNYSEFQQILNSSGKDICREVYIDNQDSIRIKKETTAIRNFEKIFDAVFKITYEKGFQAMSMRDLSSETGMSMGALYGYFSSKEELLAIIQRQGRSMVKRVFEKFLDPSEDSLEKLRSVIKVHLFLSESARPWFFFTFMEARNLAPDELEEVISLEAYTEKILVDILESGEKKGVFRKRDHQLTASIIKGMQQEWYLKRWKYAKRNISIDQYAEYVLEFVESFCIAKGKS